MSAIYNIESLRFLHCCKRWRIFFDLPKCVNWWAVNTFTYWCLFSYESGLFWPFVWVFVALANSRHLIRSICGLIILGKTISRLQMLKSRQNLMKSLRIFINVFNFQLCLHFFPNNFISHIFFVKNDRQKNDEKNFKLPSNSELWQPLTGINERGFYQKSFVRLISIE